MPICERDPWRFQFFEDVACPDDVNISTDDFDSWEWYPEWRWTYEKLNIARSQNLACGGADDMPLSFPVFMKPNINLRGMGIGSKRIESVASFIKHRRDGQMWMPLLKGEHISTDIAIVNGEPKWLRHAHGYSWFDGMFKHWVIETTQRIELRHYLSAWVKHHMAGYTGMMNFETIGGVIIETHLRFADQWCDLYGAAWMDALVGLYAKGHWNFDESRQREGYSVPLFASHGKVPKQPSAQVQAAIRALPHVTSLQITFYEAKADEAHPMPPGGFRLGLINCTNLEAGFAARRLLAAAFPECEIMMP